MTKTKTLHGILLFVTLLATGALAASREQVLYSFTSADYLPGGVIFDALGNLYGVSSNEGQYGYGRVFELSPSVSGWTETVLYSFTGGKDGANPSPTQSLVFNTAGNLYGTTVRGGTLNVGTVFNLLQKAEGTGPKV